MTNATNIRHRTVELRASASADPAAITLAWRAAPANRYRVFRRLFGAGDWGAATELAGECDCYTDTDVSAGLVYEYQVAVEIVLDDKPWVGFGYVCAGVDLAPVEARGTVLLIVERGIGEQLAGEIQRLVGDMIGDGWVVCRRDVGRDDNVADVKSLITKAYGSDSAHVNTVYLLGHVPVPYSGNVSPDGHPDHAGAWPADIYYADMSGVWTDGDVDNDRAQFPENHNVPGDGKFDQSSVERPVELIVGRVDLANMPAFEPLTEVDLLRRYLDRNHAFRHAHVAHGLTAIVDDHFGDRAGEAFSISGWRGFAPFVGASNVNEAAWFDDTRAEPHLWAYGCGPGWVTAAGGVCESADFVSKPAPGLFTLLFGSYFGDWDKPNSLLRAPLAATEPALTCAWAGRPHWYIHPMALGETIGFCARLTQNNAYYQQYQNANMGVGGIHVALMGDPTLRVQPVPPPKSVSADRGPDGVTVTWELPDADADVAHTGYYVYRAASDAGPFVRVTPEAIDGTRFVDSPGDVGSAAAYMVRTLRREGSCGYGNLSQGIVANVLPE